MTNPSPPARRVGPGWALLGSGWSLFAAAVAIAFVTSPGVPTVTELGRTGRLWALLPVVALAGILVLLGCRYLAGRWFAFLLFVPLLCVGGFFASIAASGQAIFVTTGDKATCTVAGEVYKPIPRKSKIRGYYKVACPDAEYTVAQYQGDDSRQEGERVEVIRDPSGKKAPVFADTVGPSDLLVMLLIPLALVVAPPIALSRLGGTSRTLRRADPDRGPFGGNWPTPPGGHTR